MGRHKLKGNTIREQAIAEMPLRAVLYQLSYRRMETPGGTRTRDLFVISDVTAIFTTDRERVGRELAMLLPPEGVSELRHCCRPDSNLRPPLARRSTEVTDIFTTACLGA